MDRRIPKAALVTILLVVTLAPATSVAAQPEASTVTLVPESPVTPIVAGIGFVFLPLVNKGVATAGEVQVRSVALDPPAIRLDSHPILRSGLTLPPGARTALDIRFDAATLHTAQSYVLTVQGTYATESGPSAFTVSATVAFGEPSDFVRTEVEHWQALESVDAFFDTLPGLDSAADMVALRQFIATRGEFVESGITADDSSVWAIFADGQVIVIGNDREPASGDSQPVTSVGPGVSPGFGLLTAAFQDPPTTAAAPALRDHDAGAPQLMAKVSTAVQAPTELPESSNVRVMKALGLGWLGAEVPADLMTWLKQKKYIPVGPAEASVESLKTVGGEGVLYVASHGRMWKRGANDPYRFGLWTSTGANLAEESTARSEFDDLIGNDTTLPRLVRIKELQGIDVLTKQKVYEWHYAITAEFVRHYWQPFSAHSLVFIDACNSDRDSDFKMAVFEKNASVYAGWTFNVDDAFAANTARLVFDRLLGVNEFQSEREAGHKQRPFDYTQVMQDLPKHWLGVKSYQPYKLLEFTNSPLEVGDTFGLLAPSIATEVVDDAAGQLHVFGTFGQDPGMDHRNVTVGGIPLACSWQPSHITCDLPASGPGSTGPVDVSVREHQSNAGMLTQWQGVFRFTLSPGETLVQRQTYYISIRADIRTYRRQIHDAPGEPYANINNPPSGAGSFACEGSASRDYGYEYTLTWNGSGDLVPFTAGNSLSANSFNFDAFLVNSHALLVHFGPVGSECTTNMHFHVVDPNTGEVVDMDFPGTHPVDGLTSSEYGAGVALSLDMFGDVLPGTEPRAIGYDFGFDGIARAVLQWERIAAMNPPDPDSAR